jgi:lipid-binding SYLF domain-containing protein
LRIGETKQEKPMRTLTRRDCLAGLIAAPAAASVATPALAASAGEINADVFATMRKFELRVRSGYDLAQRAAGVLVFPSVVKAGFGVGGEYGEGALLVGNQPVEYYNTISASVGFQFGAQARSVIILFMTPEALNNFRRKKGWKVGVDGSVALVTLGVGGAIDTNTINRPVLGFILDNKGLMYNLTLEGSKISRIDR